MKGGVYTLSFHSFFLSFFNKMLLICLSFPYYVSFQHAASRLNMGRFSHFPPPNSRLTHSELDPHLPPQGPPHLPSSQIFCSLRNFALI